MNQSGQWLVHWVKKYKIVTAFAGLVAAAIIIMAITRPKETGVTVVNTSPEKVSGDSTPLTANSSVSTATTGPKETGATVVTAPPEKVSGDSLPLTAKPKLSTDGMVWIPGGTFIMGSEKGDNDEKPIHQVTVNGFYMDRTEVTQKDFKLLMGVNPSNFKGCPMCPVERISWYDAILYCNTRTKAAGSVDTVYRYTSKTGEPGKNLMLGEISIDLQKNGFRLPTETEWEYACHAGSTTRYYWGDEMVEGYVWNQSNSGQRTHAVGQTKPNNYGLYDISGNVWEWCNDWYGSFSYGNNASKNPKGPDNGIYRVFRGGSWFNDDATLRCTIRKGSAPDVRDFHIGFRCVLSQ